MNYEKIFKYFLLVPATFGVLGFLFSGFMIIPNEWESYNKLKRSHDQLLKKVYGALPDDMDGLTASIKKEIEMEKLIDDAKIVIPKIKDLFSSGLPKIKEDIKHNTDYIDRVRNIGN